MNRGIKTPLDFTSVYQLIITRYFLVSDKYSQKQLELSKVVRMKAVSLLVLLIFSRNDLHACVTPAHVFLQLLLALT